MSCKDRASGCGSSWGEVYWEIKTCTNVGPEAGAGVKDPREGLKSWGEFAQSPTPAGRCG